MSLHLQRQFDKLKKMILALGAQVEESVQEAIRSVQERDPAVAQQVIDRDELIDEAEIDVEEECLHTLALHQPVAFDLRFVVAVLKINNELERIGDLSVNIAEQATALAQEPPMPTLPFDLDAQTRRVRNMLTQSLDALVTIDASLAQQVREQDDAVDDTHRSMYRHVEQAIREDVEDTERLIHLLSVSRNLERIADHAVNIAEDVIYMAKGEILRHRRPHLLSERPTAAQ